jgi:predicted GH43/DUF377 family glycosyl hydrolase
MNDTENRLGADVAHRAQQPAVSFTRLGIVAAPTSSDTDSESVINPACTRTRDGDLVVFPRTVAAGNVSRVARYRPSWNGDDLVLTPDGFVLEPQAPYERRATPGGYGCEDPRVTFVPVLDRYLMAYCAYGPTGARVAVATSLDAYHWTRLGLVDFHGNDGFGDKDAAFFPEIVTAPSGVPSFALMHRPTLHASVADGRGVVPAILAMPPRDRESICISYISAERVGANLGALLDSGETSVVMRPDGEWGSIKVGAGTPPVRTDGGWLFMYHGIDSQPGHEDADRPALRYRAGVALLDLAKPSVLTYRSPQPVLSPELPEERMGIVDDVVFPTAIDPRADLGQHTFDIYYGMGDRVTGRGRLTVNL